MRELFNKIIQVLLILLSALGGTIAIINAHYAINVIGEIIAIICGAFMLMCSGALLVGIILIYGER